MDNLDCVLLDKENNPLVFKSIMEKPIEKVLVKE